jgi:hypothetical protein
MAARNRDEPGDAGERVEGLVVPEPEDLGIDELRALARRRGIESVDDLDRDELVERIRATDLAGA